MRKGMAGVGIIVVASLFVLFAPVVPASAHAAHSSGSQPCAAANCLIFTSDVQGYGSVSYRLLGVGGYWYNGYSVATSANFTVRLPA